MVKKIREVLLVALVLCFCISQTAFAQTEKPIPNYQIIENITPEKAYSLIQSYREGCPCNRENFVIIDVRTPEEYANGYIENAINLDYYSKTFKDELNKLDKNKAYLNLLPQRTSHQDSFRYNERTRFYRSLQHVGGNHSMGS